MSAKDKILLGRITRPHGIRGEVFVDWYAEEIDYLEDEILLEHPAGVFKKMAVENFKEHKNGLLLTLAGTKDRNGAELLRGAQIWIDRDQLPELPDNEAYIEDLLGRRVVLADGTEVGVLHHIEMPAGQMLFALRSSEFEYLLPAHEDFLVDLGDPIVIDPPEGLLETCRTPLKQPKA